eukprot:3933152-Rhodomonas_salina.1
MFGPEYRAESRLSRRYAMPGADFGSQEEEKLAEEVNQIHLETQRMGNQVLDIAQWICSILRACQYSRPSAYALARQCPGEEVQKKNMERKLEDELAQ